MKVFQPRALVHRTATSVDRFEPTTRLEPGSAFTEAVDCYQNSDGGANSSPTDYYLKIFGPLAGGSYGLDAIEFHSRHHSPVEVERDIQRALQALGQAKPGELPSRALRSAVQLLHRTTLPEPARERIGAALEEWKEQGLCHFEDLAPEPDMRLEVHGNRVIQAPVPPEPNPVYDDRISAYARLRHDEPAVI